ncbi:succinylglutamate desuccinylase/aspartoacylase family protein [Agrococcus beijingensis]|uniref:succinylglutamate desuccinylase/aspartoacylase family protein n=1 Tax=Agrococcus beijingensis TaxID=3068634 RepID=UPI0027418F8B|nr:succinylglutamate desuccinylase/aspartoacylase family protein [Agrococcus sp. REN33]
MARESFAIGGLRVRPGQAKSVDLPIARLVTGGDVSLPVRVVHGIEPGPAVWLDAAVHGDEVVGVEVIRQVLASVSPRTLRGTLVAVPVVNVLGFMTGDRYLPDRRDLNRSFPGSARGSLASRIAHLLMTEVVGRCDVGIDLHTGSDRRDNLPQIRADLDDPETRRLAEAFGAPVMLHARLRDGSLRQAARDAGAIALLYEGGEALRLEEAPIVAGVAGVLRVLAALGMLDDAPAPEVASATSRSSGWVRSRGEGILHLEVALGDQVVAGQRLGRVADAFSTRGRLVRADRAGLVIGLARAPIVHAGDAVAHIAELLDEPAAPGRLLRRPPEPTC